MEKDFFTVHFGADGIRYEGQVWPDRDQNDQLFCQFTYHKTDLPSESVVIYIEKKQRQWVQKIIEDGEHRASAEFMVELNKQMDLL